MNTFRSPKIRILSENESLLESRIQDVQEVQLLRVGTFYDSRYGAFDITPKMLGEMVNNFVSHVRGIDLMVDFGHKSDEEAAGWIRTLVVRNDGNELWGQVHWTTGGKKKLGDRAYAYLSADFDPNYKDNETGASYGCVLLGAGLTNRPVIKKMEAVIVLSEGEKKMRNEKKLADIAPADMLKLSSLMEEMGVASVDDLISKIGEFRADNPKEEKAETPKEEKTETPKEEMEMGADEKKKMMTLESENKELKEKITLGEKSNSFNKMLAEGKTVEAQRSAFVSGDMVKFAELAGAVNLDPKGSEGTKEKEEVSGDEDDKILKLAEAKLAKKECRDIGEAVSQVIKELKLVR